MRLNGSTEIERFVFDAMNRRITQLENEFVNLWFYPEWGIIHHQFLQPVEDEAFRSVLMAGLGLLKQNKASKWLSDERQNTILPQETAAWAEQYWFPRAHQAGWKYWAVVPPLKARGRISMERVVTNLIDEQNLVKVEVFADPEKAIQWLAQQPNS